MGTGEYSFYDIIEENLEGFKRHEKLLEDFIAVGIRLEVYGDSEIIINTNIVQKLEYVIKTYKQGERGCLVMRNNPNIKITNIVFYTKKHENEVTLRTILKAK